MKLKDKILISLGIFIVSACGSTLVMYSMPIALDIFTSLRNYNQRIAEQSDYTKITTPLSRESTEDICSKFEIETTSAHCIPGSVVYGPDFFDEIKVYLKNLPIEDKTFNTIQEKLGTYLVRCGNPDNEGHYSCRYDLRGDGIYPILVFFDEKGYFYRVIANTSGS